MEWEVPVELRHREPVVLIHGGGGQGTDWLGTPDGRPGWARLLSAEGFAVHVVDRPGHGRSPLHPDLLGPIAPPLSYEAAARMFTGSDQWPGRDQDAVLDQFMVAQGPRLADLAAAHALEQRVGVELLERIGPAVVMTHSAGGPMGWLMADARPDLVRALIALEPLGPPFREAGSGGMELPWGLAAAPLTYAPGVDDPAQLAGTDGPPRQLPRLAQVPIAVVSAERSPLAAPTAETARFLTRRGCACTHLALAEHGVRGNGHGMIFERNHGDVLRVVLAWLSGMATRWEGQALTGRAG